MMDDRAVLRTDREAVRVVQELQELLHLGLRFGPTSGCVRIDRDGTKLGGAIPVSRSIDGPFKLFVS